MAEIRPGLLDCDRIRAIEARLNTLERIVAEIANRLTAEETDDDGTGEQGQSHCG